ncbi:unnamed protein product [Prorocentrum cordatum]|uniref:Uncharacterized protein n=1 Tax=Prorocentrum cordatum TaxID=2364126 RepID=A0ABN9SQI6_9DINO|nr:unnamed protein product [Polarella glacialis]
MATSITAPGPRAPERTHRALALPAEAPTPDRAAHWRLGPCPDQLSSGVSADAGRPTNLFYYTAKTNFGPGCVQQRGGPGFARPRRRAGRAEVQVSRGAGTRQGRGRKSGASCRDDAVGELLA